jgi:hypothetical protein
MNKRLASVLVDVGIWIMLVSPAAFPCTTFTLQQGNRLVFGRNLDWYSGTGLVMVNPRGLEKAALVNPSEKPARWISRFGSITFNQIGRELPFGGMNERGLVVEHMTLDETEYPSKDNRYAISAFQWIQYQLDNDSTIEEVIHSDSFLRIVDANSKIHFLVCDRSGRTAAIEFLNGRMACHAGKNLPVRALANSTYEESLNCYNHKCGTQSNPSLRHFCAAAELSDHADSSADDSTIACAFHMLNRVSQELFTKWSIVYDIPGMRIYFKVFETPTIVGENKIFMKQPPYDPPTKWVEFKGLDFNCSDMAKVLDLDGDRDQSMNRYFVNYSTDINMEFIAKAFNFYKGWGLNIELKEEEMDSLAKYPETFECMMDGSQRKGLSP